jgi:hypothetical protein
MATLVHALPVSGQVLRSVSIEADAGSGDGRGGNFMNRNFASALVDVSVVVPITPRVGGFITAAYDRLGFAIARGDVCRRDPGVPGCLSSFPTGSGSSLTLGGALPVGTHLEFRAGLGAGAFNLNDSWVGGGLADAEVAVFPVGWLGIVARGRRAAIPRYRGDRLSLSQSLLGVRIRHSTSQPAKSNEMTRIGGAGG